MSTFTLNGTPLDLDPTDYDMLGGRRRGSIHKIIGGGTVIQDRGIDVTDLVIQMQGQLINQSTLDALYTLYRLTGSEFTFVDDKGNSFQVVFTPGVESFKAKPIRGSQRGFAYIMQLSVRSVNTWLTEIGGFPPIQ